MRASQLRRCLARSWWRTVDVGWWVADLVLDGFSCLSCRSKIWVVRALPRGRFAGEMCLRQDPRWLHLSLTSECVDARERTSIVSARIERAAKGIRTDEGASTQKCSSNQHLILKRDQPSQELLGIGGPTSPSLPQCLFGSKGLVPCSMLSSPTSSTDMEPTELTATSPPKRGYCSAQVSSAGQSHHNPFSSVSETHIFTHFSKGVLLDHM